MALMDWLSGSVFKLVHGNNLVYNTCWEDPRLDRVALELKPTDNVLVITSAGCNALDYALTETNHVYAVDMNPRQNALLELKLAGIRKLDYGTFFEIFGCGYSADARQIYQQQLRPELTSWARSYWDRRINYFGNRRRPFYFRGTSGAFARLINVYINRFVRVRRHVDDLLAADSVEEQREIYDKHIHPKFWTRAMRFTLNRDTTLSMVGVPKAQRRQVENQYDGGIVQFIEDCVESVFARLPIHDNYFWRVYLKGCYSPECCPEYLKQANFQRLKDGLVDRVSVHTDSVQGFLEKNEVPISRFVLLDHMDWLSDRFFPVLESEWEWIFRRATPDARAIWRSGGMRTDFIDRVEINRNGEIVRIAELLRYHPELSNELHELDRVHTYGSFYITDFAA